MKFERKSSPEIRPYSIAAMIGLLKKDRIVQGPTYFE